MKKRCIKLARESDPDRKLSDEEIDDLEKNLSNSLKRLAIDDSDSFSKMSREERLLAASQMSYEDDIRRENQKKILAVNIKQANDRIKEFLDKEEVSGQKSNLKALQKFITFDAGGNNPASDSLDARIHAITQQYVSQMLDAFDLTKPKYLGLFNSIEGRAALLNELWGKDANNGTYIDNRGVKRNITPQMANMAKQGAKEWNKVITNIVNRYNSLGGNIQYLSDWHVPQKLNGELVLNLGRDKGFFYDNHGIHLSKFDEERARNKFADIMSDNVDPEKYVNLDGSLMSDQQRHELFRTKIFDTIATNGEIDKKSEIPPNVKRSLTAQRIEGERSIFYKNPDSYMKIMDTLGDRSTFTMMMEHVRRLSSEIAEMETFGDPDKVFNKWLNDARKHDLEQNIGDASKISEEANYTKGLYDFITGKNTQIASKAMAVFFDTLRGSIAALRLSKAVVGAFFGDNATLYNTAHYLGLKKLDILHSHLAALNLNNKEELKRAQINGLALNVYLNNMNRFGANFVNAKWINKISDAQFRLNLLTAHTEAAKRAFQTALFAKLGDIAERYDGLGKIQEGDRLIFDRYGISEDIFNVWKRAEKETWGKVNGVLSPEAIRAIPDEALGEGARALKNKSIEKLLSIGYNEGMMAVPESDAKIRYAMLPERRGQLKSEIAACISMFKSYPVGMFSRNIERGFSMGPARAAKYMSAMIASQWILGAAALQTSAIIDGKNPYDMSEPSFWLKSLLTSGSGGLYLAFLLNTSVYGKSSSLSDQILGPVSSFAEDLLGMPGAFFDKNGRVDTKSGGLKMVKFAQNNIPFMNSIYTKAAFDHLIFNQLAEMASPGYLSKVKTRYAKQGQSFWWDPNETMPSRLPDLGKALGK